jgi:ribosomal protein S18 acetylase RimI-like enzyme
MKLVSLRIPQSHQSPAIDIRPLTPADVDRVMIDPRRGIDADELMALVVQAPGMSFWQPDSGEFILLTPWRHRLELPTIHTVSAFRFESELIRAAIDATEAAGSAGLIYIDSHETRRPAFYARHGLEQIEEIVTYELDRPPSMPLDLASLAQTFIQVPIHDEGWLQAVLAVDHLAFPWLWWNSREEFQTYLQYPGVEVWAGCLGDEVTSYVGLTHYYGWGHLDRIATRPDYQGRGLGREALAFAIDRMVMRGGKRVALSTQGNNARSRRLYANHGFRATPQHDYTVFGAIFDTDRVPRAGGETNGQSGDR